MTLYLERIQRFFMFFLYIDTYNRTVFIIVYKFLSIFSNCYIQMYSRRIPYHIK